MVQLPPRHHFHHFITTCICRRSCTSGIRLIATYLQAYWEYTTAAITLIHCYEPRVGYTLGLSIPNLCHLDHFTENLSVLVALKVVAGERHRRLHQFRCARDLSGHETHHSYEFSLKPCPRFSGLFQLIYR